MNGPTDWGSRARERFGDTSRRGRLAASAERLARFFLLSFGKTHEDGLLLIASALAYITILSLIPLLAAFSFIGTRVFSQYQQQSMEVFVQVLPYHEATVTDQIEKFLAQAQSLSGWGLAILFATALFTFGTIEQTINRIWNVSKARPFKVRFLSFTLLMAWGPILVGATFSSLFLLGRELRDRLILEAPERILESSALLALAPFVGTLLGLTLLYWLVPYTSVSFRCALAGGLTGAILLEVLRQGFGLYVDVLKNASMIYGSFSFALFFAISIQLTWAIVLYGSVVSYTAQHYGALDRGLVGRQAPAQGRWVGLAAAAVLAGEFDRGRPVTPLGSLADCLVLPADRLESLLRPLEKAGVVNRTEGRDRGYMLARPPHKMPVERVLAAYDSNSHRVFRPLGDDTQRRLDALARRIEQVRSDALGEVTLARLTDDPPPASPDPSVPIDESPDGPLMDDCDDDPACD